MTLVFIFPEYTFFIEGSALYIFVCGISVSLSKIIIVIVLYKIFQKYPDVKILIFQLKTVVYNCLLV